MNRFVRVVAGIAPPMMVLAGCAAAEVPTPNSTLPPRPATLSINRVDPCAMFDNEQKATLHLRRETPTTPTVSGRPSRGCVWITSSGLTYGVQTIPVSADAAIADPATDVVVINGFGAVRGIDTQLDGGAPNCQITVDAADQESIRLQVRGSGRANRSGNEMCRLATEAASMVMTTVVRTAG